MEAIRDIPYELAPEGLRRDIAILMHQVWPEVSALPDDAVIPNPHEEGWKVQSFYVYADGQLASYVGIVQKQVTHRGALFNIAGLSCVATDPAYRGRSLGHQTVAAATRWLERQPDVDFGIFTCHPSLAEFYDRAGGWRVVPDVLLIGSEQDGALTSDSLPVVVLQRLFSEKAKTLGSQLRHTTINLDVPVGQFL